MGIKLQHPIALAGKEKDQLQTLVHKGIAQARTITRARVLLLADDGKTDREIYESLALAVSTPYDIRKRYHSGGLQNALYDTPHQRRRRKLTVQQEAKIVATACTNPPIGAARWTMDLLTEVVNKLGIQIGRTAIWKLLVRNDTKPWRKKNVVYPASYV